MGLQTLELHNVRNIEHAKLESLSAINLFYGENGSGKTSVLEAIGFLATSKSFRNNQIKHFIRKDQAAVTVFAKVHQQNQALKIGVSRDKTGERQAKVNGENIRRLVDLAQLLPFQLLYHKTFTALSEGPSVRRQLLDWGVFHVEQMFRESWVALLRVLKQRNALLKQSNIQHDLLSYWDVELVKLSNTLHQSRTDYIEKFTPEFFKYIKVFLPELNIEDMKIQYYSGWSKQHSFEQVLKDSLEKDTKYGYTQFGPQRAHIDIEYEKVPASQRLSRGQLKMLLMAFKLAQSDILNQSLNQQSIYLLDDLPSELDEKHLGLLCQSLSTINAQLFVTGIEKKTLKSFFEPAKSRLFHVEHGKIKAC